MKRLYLALFVLGCALPLSQLVPWLIAHGGLDPRLFLAELFANRISGFFALDVVVSAVVVLSWIAAERGRLGLRHPWLPVAATLFIGVSAGLPLLLYMRREEPAS
jgi:Terpene cyclase DEP1